MPHLCTSARLLLLRVFEPARREIFAAMPVLSNVPPSPTLLQNSATPGG